jgi:hypothetical protein
MDPTKILVKICCDQPSWVENYPKLLPSIYRLYINNDLLTERSWIYGNHNALHEEIYAKLKINDEYTLRVEPVVKNPAQARFKINDFTTPYKSTVVTDCTDLSITFKLS